METKKFRLTHHYFSESSSTHEIHFSCSRTSSPSDRRIIGRRARTGLSSVLAMWFAASPAAAMCCVSRHCISWRCPSRRRPSRCCLSRRRLSRRCLSLHPLSLPALSLPVAHLPVLSLPSLSLPAMSLPALSLPALFLHVAKGTAIHLGDELC